MSNANELGAVVYEAETAFAENQSTFATHRIPVLGVVDVTGLTHAKIDPNRVNQFLQDGSPHIPGVMGGSFTTEMWATGHGSSTAGATTVDALETFLSYIFSGAGALGAGGTVTMSAAAGTTATGGTLTVPTTAASGTLASGSLCRIGTLNDGRGNGQAYAINTHITNSLTLLTDMDLAPTNGDVIYSGANLYLPETPSNAVVTGLRFLLATANLRYEAHGCFPMAIKLTGTSPNQLPKWSIQWGVSWWKPSTAGAFPSAVASNQYNPAPISSGSLFVQDVGTTTRVKRTIRDFSIEIKLGIVPLPGPGGVNPSQMYVGARRVPTDIRVKFTEDVDAAATTTPALEAFWLNSTSKHILWTGSATPGSSLATYAPNVRIVGARPIQRGFNKINSIAVEGECNTGPTTTSELLASALRVFYS